MKRPWTARFRCFRREDQAATAVEYAVMLGLILAVVIGAVRQVSNRSGGMYGNIQAEMKAHGM